MAITQSTVSTDVEINAPYWSFQQEVKNTKDVIIITDLITGGGGDPLDPIEIPDAVAWIKCTTYGMEVLAQAPSVLPTNHTQFSPLKKYRVIQRSGVEELYAVEYDSEIPANHTRSNRENVKKFSGDQTDPYVIYVKTDMTSNLFDLYY